MRCSVYPPHIVKQKDWPSSSFLNPLNRGYCKRSKVCECWVEMEGKGGEGKGGVGGEGGGGGEGQWEDYSPIGTINGNKLFNRSFSQSLPTAWTHNRSVLAD